MGNELERGKGYRYQDNVESQYPFVSVFVTEEALQKKTVQKNYLEGNGYK